MRTHRKAQTQVLIAKDWDRRDSFLEKDAVWYDKDSPTRAQSFLGETGSQLQARIV